MSMVIGKFPYANPNCQGCGERLTVENAWMQDGCPCNTTLGVNSMNETRWVLLMHLQQKQQRELASIREEKAGVGRCPAYKPATPPAKPDGEEPIDNHVAIQIAVTKINQLAADELGRIFGTKADRELWNILTECQRAKCSPAKPLPDGEGWDNRQPVKYKCDICGNDLNYDARNGGVVVFKQGQTMCGKCACAKPVAPPCLPPAPPGAKGDGG